MHRWQEGTVVLEENIAEPPAIVHAREAHRAYDLKATELIAIAKRLEPPRPFVRGERGHTNRPTPDTAQVARTLRRYNAGLASMRGFPYDPSTTAFPVDDPAGTGTLLFPPPTRLLHYDDSRLLSQDAPIDRLRRLDAFFAMLSMRQNLTAVASMAPLAVFIGGGHRHPAAADDTWTRSLAVSSRFPPNRIQTHRFARFVVSAMAPPRAHTTQLGEAILCVGLFERKGSWDSDVMTMRVLYTTTSGDYYGRSMGPAMASDANLPHLAMETVANRWFDIQRSMRAQGFLSEPIRGGTIEPVRTSMGPPQMFGPPKHGYPMECVGGDWDLVHRLGLLLESPDLDAYAPWLDRPVSFGWLPALLRITRAPFGPVEWMDRTLMLRTFPYTLMGLEDMRNKGLESDTSDVPLLPNERERYRDAVRAGPGGDTQWWIQPDPGTTNEPPEPFQDRPIGGQPADVAAVEPSEEEEAGDVFPSLLSEADGGPSPESGGEEKEIRVIRRTSRGGMQVGELDWIEDWGEALVAASTDWQHLENNVGEQDIFWTKGKRATQWREGILRNEYILWIVGTQSVTRRVAVAARGGTIQDLAALAPPIPKTDRFPRMRWGDRFVRWMGAVSQQQLKKKGLRITPLRVDHVAVLERETKANPEGKDVVGHFVRGVVTDTRALNARGFYARAKGSMLAGMIRAKILYVAPPPRLLDPASTGGPSTRPALEDEVARNVRMAHGVSKTVAPGESDVARRYLGILALLAWDWGGTAGLVRAMRWYNSMSSTYNVAKMLTTEFPSIRDILHKELGPDLFAAARDEILLNPDIVEERRLRRLRVRVKTQEEEEARRRARSKRAPKPEERPSPQGQEVSRKGIVTDTALLAYFEGVHGYAEGEIRQNVEPLLSNREVDPYMAAGEDKLREAIRVRKIHGVAPVSDMSGDEEEEGMLWIGRSRTRVQKVGEGAIAVVYARAEPTTGSQKPPSMAVSRRVDIPPPRERRSRSRSMDLSARSSGWHKGRPASDGYVMGLFDESDPSDASSGCEDIQEPGLVSLTSMERMLMGFPSVRSELTARGFRASASLP